MVVVVMMEAEEEDIVSLERLMVVPTRDIPRRVLPVPLVIKGISTSLALSTVTFFSHAAIIVNEDTVRNGGLLHDSSFWREYTYDASQL